MCLRWTRGLLGVSFVLGVLIPLTSSSALVMGQQTQVEVLVIFTGQSLDAFRKVAAAFEEKNPGITVLVDRPPNLVEVLVSRIKAGNPPDISVIPNPGQLKEFVAGIAQPGVSDVVSLEFLRQLLEQEHPKGFVDLGTFSGPDGIERIYGLLFSANVKSLVWHNPNVLGQGFELGSWNELLAFTKGAAAAGKTAWCIGLESAGGSGWPGTDWIEDIMLRTAGPEVYDQWIAHDIPWTDARIKNAFEMFGQIARNPQFVLGGPQGVLSINFAVSPNGLFTSPPGCLLHHQASFIQTFIQQANPSLHPVEDFNIFLFPPIDPALGNPLLGGGSIIGLLKDSEINRKFMEFLASADGQQIWVNAGGQEPPTNRTVDLSALDPISMRVTELMRGAEAFRFDASDLMPSAIGSGVFWTAVLDYVSGADVCDVLRKLEATSEQIYTSGAATNGIVEPGAC